MTSILYFRKVYQMTVVSIVLVALITLIIALSLSASEVDVIECEELQMVVEMDPPNVLLTWDTNSCAVAYNITHYMNGEIINTAIIPNPVHTFLTYWRPCGLHTVVIGIIARPNAGEHVPGKKDFGTGLTGDPLVRNLRFEEEYSRFVWEPPEESSEACDIEYRIYFESKTFSEEITIREEFYEITVHPCSINTISVTTLVNTDNSYSSDETLSYRGPTQREEPVHVSTDPQFFHADIIWQIGSKSINFCQVDEVRFEVVEVVDETSNQVFPIPYDGKADYVEYSLTSLTVETMHDYRSCFTFTDSDVTACSSYVRFFTRPLEKPVIDVNIGINNENSLLRITWEQFYLQEFVTANSLRIVPEGPEHFVPDHCEFDLSPFEKTFEPGETSFDFEDTKPSFRYKIIITTHFDSLGRSTASDDSIITDDDDPGDLTASAGYQYTPAALYNVAAEARWLIPCDINGKVKRFAYEISGTFTSAITAICQDVILDSGDIYEYLEEEVHTLSIPGILPFFEYKMTITTHLDEHQGTKVLNLGPAPEAYTPVGTR